LAVLMVSSTGAAPDCPSLGFTESLACSACDKLQENVKNERLLGECRSTLFAARAAAPVETACV
jgi:hypothetical protein